MKVLSFNIRNACDKGTEAWENRLPNFLKLIKAADPDLMGFQEVLHRQWLDLVDNFKEYSQVGIGRDDGLTKGEYAAIFYKKDRFELLETNSFWLSETPEKPSMGWDAVCIRICTYAKLLDLKTKKTFIYYNTHLDHVGKSAMINGAKLIKERILSQKYPSFVTGDFNVTENSNPYNVMNSDGLSDSKFAAKESMSCGTYHDYKENPNIYNESPIDYLFYTTNDFSIKTYKVLVNGKIGAYTSDHYPVLVELDLT